MQVWGQLLKAGLEHSASDITPAVKGMIYWNTTSDVPKIYDGSNWIELTAFDSSGHLNLRNQKELRLLEQSGNGTNYMGLSAPDAVTTSTTLKLPDGPGTNGYALTTDGSSQLGWTAVATVSNNETQAKSADYTITDTDNARTILMTTGATNRTVTLPTAADNAHRIITIKKVDSGTGKCTVDGEGAETIDGVSTVDIVSHLGEITVQCDGTDWHIIAGSVGRRWQIKIAASDTTSAGTILSFSVEAGKTYEYFVQVSSTTSSSATTEAAVKDNTTVLSRVRMRFDTGVQQVSSTSGIVTMGSTTLTLDAVTAAAGAPIDGNNTRSETYMIVREPQYHIPYTGW